MPRRRFILALAFLILPAMTLWAGEKGSQELAKGREALARQDYQAAAEHLTAAVGDLDPRVQKEEAADAWLQLGLVQLTGLGRPEEALAGFQRSAELAANPASAWLWASVAAEKLGRSEDAGAYKSRALAPPPAPAAAAPPSETPATAPTPQPEIPAAAPGPAKEKAKGAAFDHFFAKAATKPAEKEKKEEAEPASEQDTKKKVSAFDHFFGEKKEEKKGETGESGEQKPPW